MPLEISWFLNCELEASKKSRNWKRYFNDFIDIHMLDADNGLSSWRKVPVDLFFKRGHMEKL